MDDLPAGSVFVPEDAPVYDMPVSAINRPLMSALDECKLQQFMDDMQFTPIEVAWVQDGDDNYYFAFGGCHRWAAVQHLGLPTIRAKLIKVSPSTIDTYLGASSPFRKKRQAAAAATGAAVTTTQAAGVEVGNPTVPKGQ
eukprot:GHRR01023280.1.p1 GENE.GHRR01023280.1~~GHRR01023280.1.p1  ORF type:complete len:140 (+),score=39.73 GHRR01023280.1:153-572(+)